MAKYRERDWLHARYVEDELSSTQIGEMCDVTRVTICDWLDRHGIETRDPAETMKKTGVLEGENNPMHGEAGRISGDENPMRDPDVASRNAESRRGNTYPDISSAISGENNPSWGGGERTVVCDNCGETFGVCQFEVDRGRRFCSNACQGEYLSGEDHHLWKGGWHRTRNHKWRTETRPAVLDRDDHQCQGCGMTEAEHQSALDQGLHVHHIKYGTDDLSDLITLCEWCHAKVSNGKETLDSLENSRSITEKRPRSVDGG